MGNTKKLTVTVGIPAYNEEKTIENALKQIYEQKQDNYVLKEVKVISDGSDDATVNLVKNNYPEAIVRDSKQKKGKSYRVNQFLSENTSDVLILVDADIKFGSNKVLDKVIALFEKNANLGASYAYHVATKPESFAGRLAYFGYEVWDKARTKLGKRGLRYYAEGGFMAFSKRFANQLKLPKTLVGGGDDSYSFYKAVELGFDVEVDKKAVVTIDLAESFSDYVRQMRRFLKDPNIVQKHFSEILVENNETMTTKIKLSVLFTELIRSPFIGLAYVMLQAYTKITAPFSSDKNGWKPIERK